MNFCEKYFHWFLIFFLFLFHGSSQYLPDWTFPYQKAETILFIFNFFSVFIQEMESYFWFYSRKPPFFKLINSKTFLWIAEYISTFKFCEENRLLQFIKFSIFFFCFFFYFVQLILTEVILVYEKSVNNGFNWR